MSFNSILSDIGHGLKVFFTGAEKVAVAAEPVIDILFPGIAGLYNATVNEVAAAEAAAIAAGQQTGTGAQKLAMVIAAIAPTFNAYATANKIPVNTTTLTTWVNTVVASLNAIPAATP